MLDQLLRDINESVPTFCRKHGLDRLLIQRILGGRTKRPPDADVAHKIAIATDSRVDTSMWKLASLRWDETKNTDVRKVG
ncbi:hypothetical protein AKJ09_09836 [Labilithrix luteola]|uniref:Uncharacterized protein n=1 Tax=Labilithrix luteola TaxID=1391654 RepID=A0A0K1QBR1_9BACT|nr:hypothetical protein AKJ09_09836 [Labilithrix luteola]